jgi:hypothetical protein
MFFLVGLNYSIFLRNSSFGFIPTLFLFSFLVLGYDSISLIGGRAPNWDSFSLIGGRFIIFDISIMLCLSMLGFLSSIFLVLLDRSNLFFEILKLFY